MAFKILQAPWETLGAFASDYMKDGTANNSNAVILNYMGNTQKSCGTEFGLCPL